MSEPLPVQPVTLEYSGRDAALGPPIPHPGMEMRGQPSDLRRLAGHAASGALGAFYAASFIVILGWWSELWFPKWSDLRLLLPLPPILGMLVIGAAASRLSKRSSTCACSFGLWVGGFALLGLFFLYLLYLHRAGTFP